MEIYIKGQNDITQLDRVFVLGTKCSRFDSGYQTISTPGRLSWGAFFKIKDK